MLIGTFNNSIDQQNHYANKAENTQGQAVNVSVKTEVASEAEQSLSRAEPRDEYIPSGDKPESSAGVYRLEKYEGGRQRIVFDRSSEDGKNNEQSKVSVGALENTELSKQVEVSKECAKSANNTEPSKKADGGEESFCTASTDGVDREIKQLRAEMQQLEQQLASVQGGDNNKREELEKQLKQLKAELSEKDNDSYRKQHASYSLS